MSWYTDYRPRQIADLHLVSVRDQLQALLKSGHFPQVFLFAGPKGTGKTSTSRIIGAILNDPANQTAVTSLFLTKSASKKSTKPSALQEPDPQLPQNEAIFTGQSYVVTELDAASNRGIDDIRALRERVQLPPQMGLMSVYILDEVHMLTTEAFNALLKLLEEPPAHAVFILATTERHKIPATILSRVTEIQFRQATQSELESALKHVLTKVSLKAENGVLSQIAERSNGSFRDGVKLLESVATQAKSDSRQIIATSDVTAILGDFGDTSEIVTLLEEVMAKDSKAVATAIQMWRDRAIDPAAFYVRVLNLLHHQLLAALEIVPDAPVFSKPISLFFLNELADLSASAEAIPLLHLEIKLLSIIERAEQKSQGSHSGTGSGTNFGPNSESGQSTSDSSGTGKKNTSKSPSTSKVSSSNEPSSGTSHTDFETHSAAHISLAMLDEGSTEELVEEIQEKVIDLTYSATHSDSIVIPEHADSAELLKEWSQFVDLVEKENVTVAALLRSAKPVPERSNGVAKIQVFYPFHRDQLMQPKFLQLLQNCAQNLTGHHHQFEFEVGSAPAQDANVVAAATELLL